MVEIKKIEGKRKEALLRKVKASQRECLKLKKLYDELPEEAKKEMDDFVGAVGHPWEWEIGNELS